MRYLKDYITHMNEGANRSSFSGKPKVTKDQIENFISENGGSPLKEVKNSEGSLELIYSTLEKMSESFANSTELRIKTASIFKDFMDKYPNPIIEESGGSKNLLDLKALVHSILN